MLTDNRIINVLQYVRSLQMNEEAAELAAPIRIGTWNAETIEAFKEVESGDLISFESRDELYKFLDS